MRTKKDIERSLKAVTGYGPGSPTGALNLVYLLRDLVDRLPDDEVKPESNEDLRDVIVQTLTRHRIECTGREGVTCLACRERGWMSWHAFAAHQADAIIAAPVER